jgi:hypothetical protein
MIEAIFLALLFDPLGVDETSAGTVFIGIVAFQILQLQWILGAFIGWYGGYLRRRLAASNPPAAPNRRRR